ncbi:MAG: serine/threonine protein kinase [Gemmataceae bacterium]|nr:serine/threonine protein kinase [Gemmataceae bacterium]
MAEESTKRPARRTERIGKYEVLDHLATGGVGIVYKARDVDLNRLVALKILPVQLAKQETTLIRFQREAKAAAKLRHENIVAIYDIGEHVGTYYIALEFVEGTDLQDYITSKGKLDADEAREIIIQTTRALDHAFEQGIVHRDIKPSNLLLTHKGDRLLVKLTDFGLAIGKEDDEEFRITRDKMTVGTVDYISPEQACDSRSADIRSDIYSLGCTFYHMLGGVAPFARGTLPERILQHMQAPLPDLRCLNKKVPDDLLAVIDRMLAKKPGDRYQTPAELMHDLQHPDEVAPAEKVASGKSERNVGRRRNADATQFVDTDELEDKAEAGKNPRTKKRPASKKDQDTNAGNPGNDTDTPEKLAPHRKPPGNNTAAEDKAKKAAAASSPLWIYVAGGTVGLLGLVLIGALLFGGKSTPLKKLVETKKNPEQPPIVEVQDKKDDKPEVKPDTSAAKMGVGELELPVMDTRRDQADLALLRKLYYGPFTAFPAAAKDAVVLRVSRLASADAKAFRTLEAAFAATKPDMFTVIEIHDGGPLFVPVLPALSQRTILVRGGEGHRPLIVWDVANKPAPGKSTAFCTLSGGGLILDNLDFVMRWSSDAPASAFELSGTHFHARNCTFSIAGKSPQGIALVSRRSAEPTHTWLQRCYVRGREMSLVQCQEASAAVLLEESLIVGEEHPLFQLRGRDTDAFSLFCVRSTLVVGKTLLRWQASAGGGAPVHGKILDSILSRDDATAPVGDMIQLTDGGDPSAMSWRAENSVYAGWKRLLGASAKNIAGHDLDGWRRQWRYSSGDRAVVDTWPITPPPKLEEQPAGRFLPGQPLQIESAAPAPVAFTALTGPGSTGCVIGRLPPTPELWLERTFEPRTVPTISAADVVRPALEKTPAELYHGEELNLNKIDLGAYLNSVLSKKKLAPRIVLHLTGRAVCSTSPVKIKGVKHLVLYFEPAKDPREAITLEATPASLTPPALIEMTGGHLEIIGARFQLNPGTVVPTILQLHDADLTLTRSWLQGPLLTSADRFKCLITAVSTRDEPATLLLRDNVLVSSKLLIDLRDNVQLKARNNALVALGEGVRFDGSGPGGPILHLFEHNTWVARRAFLTVGMRSEVPPAGLVLVHTNSNAFLSPFADEVERPTLLRVAEPWVARGRWSWQGRHNVYDVRLHGYFTGLEKSLGAKQSLRDWQAAWGQAGEQNPDLLALGPGTKSVTIQAAVLLQQLERLALPKELRGDPGQNPPGADLTILGLRKKG